MNREYAITTAVFLLMVHSGSTLECSSFQNIQVAEGDVIEWKSPGYPANYPGLLKCGATFWPANNDVTIEMICDDIALHREASYWAALKLMFFSYDWVILSSSPYLLSFPATLADQQPQAWRMPPGQKMSFLFSTNLLGADRGFKCTITGVPQTIPPRAACGTSSQSKRSARLIDGDAETEGQDRQPRITGGTEVTDNAKWPWVVRVQNGPDLGDTDTHCTGTIISKDYVLTSATCAQKTDMYVRYGEACLGASCTPPSQNLQKQVSQVTIHQDFRTVRANGKDVYKNDIALLKVAMPFPDSVIPVCLPAARARAFKYAPGTDDIVGWDNGGAMPNNNRQNDAKATLLGRAACRRFNRAVDFRNICTNPESNSKAVCDADIGGPLMREGSDGRYTQIGIASCGPNLCDPNQAYFIYTRIDQYLPWIMRRTDIEINPY